MCSAQNTPWTRCPCLSQHWLTGALGTSVASVAAAAALAALEGKRSRSLFPAGKARFTSRGMLVCPVGNTHLPSAAFPALEQGCPLSQHRNTEQSCCSCQGSPRSSERPWDTLPAAATLSQQGRLPESRSKGWAEAGLCQPGPSAPSSPCSAPGKSGLARDAQGTGTRAARGSLPLQPPAPRLGLPLTPELGGNSLNKSLFCTGKELQVPANPQRPGRGNSEPLLQQGCEKGQAVLRAAAGTAQPGAVGLAERG